jgi:hypothetical protein
MLSEEAGCEKAQVCQHSNVIYCRSKGWKWKTTTATSKESSHMAIGNGDGWGGSWQMQLPL